MLEGAKLEGGARTTTIDHPCKCEVCNDAEWRKRWGCGCSEGVPWTATASGEGYAGQSEQPQPDGARTEPYSRTCPQWFARSPFAISVLALLEDYRGNRLGPVQQLPAPLATYLRVADREFARAKDYWDCARLEAIRS